MAVRDHLADHRTVLMFCHALAVEWRLGQALAARRGIDPIMPPLVRRLRETGSAAAAALIATDMRLNEALRRMRLPLDALPADLVHLGQTIAQAVRNEAGLGATAAVSVQAGASRVALMQDVLAQAHAGLVPVDEAGVGLLATMLAQRLGFAREQVVLAMVEDYPLRFALMLRAAGFDVETSGAQLLAIRPGSDPAQVKLVGDAQAAWRLLNGAEG